MTQLGSRHKNYTNETFIDVLLLTQKKTNTKQKNNTKKKQKTKNKIKKSVKHHCQVASPGGRSLSTEF